MNDLERNSLPVSEQEVHIWMDRDSNETNIYSSDSTYITKLDKLCASSPELYEKLSGDGVGFRYVCHDKTLISFRSKKREISEEQKEAAADRFKKLHAEGKIGRGKKGVE